MTHLEEGAAGGQHTAVCPEHAAMDAHGDVAEVSALALLVQGFQHRRAEVVQVDAVHALTAHHSRRTRGKEREERRCGGRRT